MTVGPYVGLGEVALRLDVDPARARRLTMRTDFPAPVAHISRGRVWLAEAVETWAREHQAELAEQ